MALDEQDTARRIQSGSQQERAQPTGLGSEIGGVVGDGHGVQVHHAEDAAVLAVDPAADGAGVIAEVHLTRRLDS